MKSVNEWVFFFLEAVPLEITKTRWEHSQRVAQFAEGLALLNSYPDPKLAYLAGIVHDITKQKKIEFHLELFSENPSFDMTTIPEEAYHAFTSVFYLKKKYNFFHEEVFSAISAHTLGKKEMSSLDKIIYASDFLGSEYAAKQPEFFEWLEKTNADLNFGIYLKASKTIHQLIESKRKIFPSTIDTFNETINKI